MKHDPIQILWEEHRVIEGVLECLAKMIQELRRGGSTDWEAWRWTLEFFSQFADRCHHHKEEELLFPALEQCGFSPQEGPTAVMRQEHQLGRRWIQAMRDALPNAADDPQKRRALLDAAVGYLYLLREHIQKEDHCLFPMARQALSEELQQRLGEQFQQCPQSSQEHQRWVQEAQRIRERFLASGRAGSG